LNELTPAGITRRVLSSALGALLLLSACAKKEVKPLHTEPWLAHPPASAAASSDAGLPTARYAITEQSQIHFELPSKRGTLHGSLTRVSGELSLTPSDLEHSHGQVQVDLSSLTLSEDGNGDTSERLTRARSALGLTDAAADASSPVTASFELSSLEDVAPAQLEPAPDSDAGAPFARKARATAVGNLLLHGFRVVRRAPLEAEFSFTADRAVPTTISIRSRAPFVISLETHEIRVRELDTGKKPTKGALAHAREARVSVELYGRKIE
jgi:hypothetical protein